MSRRRGEPSSRGKEARQMTTRIRLASLVVAMTLALLTATALMGAAWAATFVGTAK